MPPESKTAPIIEKSAKIRKSPRNCPKNKEKKREEREEREEKEVREVREEMEVREVREVREAGEMAEASDNTKTRHVVKKTVSTQTEYQLQ